MTLPKTGIYQQKDLLELLQAGLALVLNKMSLISSSKNLKSPISQRS